MTPESGKARIEDVRAWLRKAALDLRAAEHEASTPELGLWGDVVFHAQQAIEKSYKAFLAWHDAPFRKTHNLEELGTACAEIDDSLRLLAALSAPLTEYAWKYRYPGESEDPGAEESKRALALGHQIYEAIRTRVDSGDAAD